MTADSPDPLPHNSPSILVDADACPVKEEIYKVAWRRNVAVVLVSDVCAPIGGPIATRAIMAVLRAGMDGLSGGPAPFAKADRSRFLQALDEALVRLG